jgi:hypothetical protein
VSKFEDAIMFVMNGGRARRSIWAAVQDYTRSTPPMQMVRRWHIWQQPDVGGIINGWGGSIGGADDGDPVRNGMGYSPTNEDRIANDWELLNEE